MIGNATFLMIGAGLALALLNLALLAFAVWMTVLYVQASAARAPVPFVRLIGMSLRNVSPSVIVRCRIAATKAGIPLDTDRLEAHFLARGNVPRVVEALIAAKSGNVEMTYESACEMDLAGRDVLEEVRAAPAGSRLGGKGEDSGLGN